VAAALYLLSVVVLITEFFYLVNLRNAVIQPEVETLSSLPAGLLIIIVGGIILMAGLIKRIWEVVDHRPLSAAHKLIFIAVGLAMIAAGSYLINL